MECFNNIQHSVHTPIHIKLKLAEIKAQNDLERSIKIANPLT